MLAELDRLWRIEVLLCVQLNDSFPEHTLCLEMFALCKGRRGMKLRALLFAGIAVAMQTNGAWPHHSFAAFDAERQVTLQGVVREFQWTNPHAWIMLSVEKKGQLEQWAVELNGAYGLVRQGWRPKTLIPGMPVTLTIRPLRDGTNGGQLIEITLPDGTIMGRVSPALP